ncbi:hypothetical protein LX73_0820 [Fodinibius salinus]|uniref:DUF883 domain-containing protein n=1 Tax=Fodinibius salinus TaxID=860790 RepID=A0A5D3YR79_9BACT|nr:hypothetical protein [Fodinibius salinus]TYP95513.1 hypothetical protein LX73_0820 [Fodinibius salinus]
MNEEILDNLNDRLDEALDRGRRIVEDEELTEQVDELKGRVERMVRKHPVKSVAGGLLAGYMLGKLFSSED